MLKKPQVFYDDTHKQALGYQNPFYLKTSQRIKPTLYNGSVISSQHANSPVIDDEETLILEEVGRSKMLAKQNDPMSIEKKVNTTLINYVELNRLSEDFGKRFAPQQELSAEQAFWLQTSHPNTNQSVTSPVKIEAPRKLPKVSLVNTCLKKLKYHLGKFDIVVKKWSTPDAITEGEWGFEHTKKREKDEVGDIWFGENTSNNGKNLSEIQLKHAKEDELVAVVVKVVHELDCMTLVKEIKNGLLKEVDVSLFGKKMIILD
nr:hypothetical protein [Tanacetum cinerariifolium]